jgi:hypothetical protein
VNAWVITLVVVFVPFFWFWGILDCARRRPDAFASTGRSKRLWVWANVLLPVLGTASYIGLVRPHVKARENSLVAAATKRAADAQPAGWYDDPHGRHATRYFDGRKWTASVRDGEVGGWDLPG